MNKQRLHIPLYVLGLFALFLGTLLLAGCGAKQSGVAGASRDIEPAPFRLLVPALGMVDESAFPQDISLVAGAVVWKMRHLDNRVAVVSFDPQGHHDLAEGSFDYQGFDLSHLIVVLHDVKEAPGGRLEVDMAARLHFLDGVGRVASSLLTASYTVGPDGIVVRESSVASLQPQFPYVECYFVKAEDFRRHFNDARTFVSWYMLTREWAETMVMTPEEAAERAALEQRSTFEKLKGLGSIDKQEYYVLVFCVDRMPLGAELEVIPTKQPRAAKKPMAEVAQLNFDGWRLAVYGASLHLNHPDAEVTTLVYYTPDPDVLVQVPGRHLVGRFSSLKRQPGAGVQGRTVPAADQARLFDPANRDDARIIQSRLSELGYYSMKIDGLWGKGSAGALRAFQQDKGLPADGIWSRETQDLLLR